MPRFDLTDVSHHQSVVAPPPKPEVPINWAKVAPACPVGAVCKVTEGASIDEQAKANLAGIRREIIGAGKVGGAYFWPLPNSSLGTITNQAKFFMDVMQPQVGEALMMDNEQGGLSKAQILDGLEYMSARLGRLALNYMGRFFGGSMIMDPAFRRYPWVLPAYTTEAKYPALWQGGMFNGVNLAPVGMQPTMWQWGGGAEGVFLPGIPAPGRVDANRVENLAVLRACAGLAPSIPETPIPPPTTQGGSNVGYFMASDGPNPKPVYEIIGNRKRQMDGGNALDVAQLTASFPQWQLQVMPKMTSAQLNSVPDLPVAWATPIPGVPGPTGPQGPKGDKGDAGPAGAGVPTGAIPGVTITFP